VEQVRANGGGQERDGTDRAELGSLVDQLPEPPVQSADNSHQAPILSRVPRRVMIVVFDSTPFRGDEAARVVAMTVRQEPWPVGERYLAA
jgi:hypothetical protein